MIQVKEFWRIVPLLLIFVIFSPGVWATTDVRSTYSFSADAAFVKKPLYTLSYQLSYSTYIGVSLAFSNTFGTEFHGGVSVLRESQFADGVQYRGFTSLFGSALFDMSFPVHAGYLGGAWRIGSLIGGRIDYAQYSLTRLYLFFPGIEVVPYAKYTTKVPDRVTIRFGIPIVWFLRRDLDVFITTGVRISFLL